MSEDFCDVWLDMLQLYQIRLASGNDCKIEDLGLDRFLHYAISFVKHFNDLILGSLELPGMNMLTLLNFSDLILDARLFTTLVDNVQKIADPAERRKQAVIFYLIFEVIEFKRRYYETVKNDKAVTTESLVLIEGRLKMLTHQRELYQKRMVEDFADCQEVVEMCQKFLEFWNV